MSAMIAMAVYSTDDNGRVELTKRTLNSLLATVDFSKHRLIVSDNASCEDMHNFYLEFADSFYRLFGPGANHFKIIFNDTNIGTALAVNKAWSQRSPDEFLIKMDDDCIVHYNNWIELMEEAINRMANAVIPVGICSLKRVDLAERPDHENPWYRSALVMVPSDGSQRHIVLEKCSHTMGTCQMYNPKLIDKMGGLYQMKSVYGLDDALACHRCEIAGFGSYFIPEIPISHIDPGGTDYTEWKRKIAGENLQEYHDTVEKYKSGELSIYHPL